MEQTALDQLFEAARTESEPAINKLFDKIWDLVPSKPNPELFDFINQVDQWALDLKMQNRRLYALSVFTRGYIDFFDYKFDSSNSYCNEAIKIFEEINDEGGIAICKSIIGANYRSLGAIDLAFKILLEIYPYLTKTGAYPVFEIATGHQLAELYSESQNYAEALKLLEYTLTLIQRIGNVILEPRVLNAIGGVYLKLGKYEYGLDFLNRALELSKKHSFIVITTRVLTDIGGYYFMINDYKEATRYNREALTIREALKSSNGQITNLVNLAEIYDLQNREDEAIELLKKALTIAEELNVKAKVFQIHLQLSKIYEKTGQYEIGFEHHKKYHSIKEEVNTEDIEKKIKNFKLVMEAEQTNKENVIIKAQKVEIEQKNLELHETIDQLVIAQNQIREEKKRSDDLLLNILPEEVAEELKSKGSADARYFNDVTVLFTDFKGFTSVAERMTPQQLVNELHNCFMGFDHIMGRYGIEKIKTVGDAYLAVCGLPLANEDHAKNIVNAAIDIREFMQARKQQLGGRTFDIRIGVHSGNVVAGIVGVKKFAYDIWGDTVNTAARMEQNSEPGRINISAATYDLVKDTFECTYRGKIEAKNKGSLSMYFVEGERIIQK